MLPAGLVRERLEGIYGVEEQGWVEYRGLGPATSAGQAASDDTASLGKTVPSYDPTQSRFMLPLLSEQGKVLPLSILPVLCEWS